MSNAAGEKETLGPLVVCITSTAEERTRLAGMFDGVGVLVMASDADSASTFLERLHDVGPAAHDSEAEPDDAVDGAGGADGAGSADGAGGGGGGGVVRVGGLRLDLDRHEATWRDRPLRLTPHELRVLFCLAGSPGRVWTHEQLHEWAWDEPYFNGPAAVQSVIKRLRAKVRRMNLPLHIDTVRGLGFRLAVGTELHLVS